MGAVLVATDKNLSLIFSRPLVGKTLEGVISTLFESLIDIYVGANKDKDSQWFYEEIYNPCDIIARYPEGEIIKKKSEIFSKINLPKPIIEHYKSSLLCCVLANGYVYEGNKEMAWSLAVEAACQLGSLFGTENVRRNYNEMSASVKSDRARDGGIKRSDSYRVYKELVYEIARTDCPKSGKWKSLNNMSNIIAERFFEKAKERKLEINISTESAPDTVKRWLKKMPGIEELVHLPKRDKATPHD
jgi:hypothetical protein